MNNILYGMIFGLAVACGARSQTIEGDWQGTLKAGPQELRLALHISKDEKALKATMDSVDQNAMGIPVTSIALSGSALKFEIQTIGGSYEGKVNAERTSIEGTWTQGGGSFPLNFARVAARPQAKKKAVRPSDIDGDWQGALDAGGQKLRLALHIVTDENGLAAKMDSLDQNAMGLPVSTISRNGATLKFEMKQLAGSFEGTINPELTSISGSWSQGGNTLPLVWKRAPREKSGEK